MRYSILSSAQSINIIDDGKKALIELADGDMQRVPDKPPFRYEHQRCNHGWPNGNVTMDSKLIYERKLGHWTFVSVYGKSIRENQVKKIHVAAIDPGVRTFLTCILPQLVTAVSVTMISTVLCVFVFL